MHPGLTTLVRDVDVALGRVQTAYDALSKQDWQDQNQEVLLNDLSTKAILTAADDWCHSYPDFGVRIHTPATSWRRGNPHNTEYTLWHSGVVPPRFEPQGGQEQQPPDYGIAVAAGLGPDPAFSQIRAARLLRLKTGQQLGRIVGDVTSILTPGHESSKTPLDAYNLPVDHVLLADQSLGDRLSVFNTHDTGSDFGNVFAMLKGSCIGDPKMLPVAAIGAFGFMLPAIYYLAEGQGWSVLLQSHVFPFGTIVRDVLWAPSTHLHIVATSDRVAERIEIHLR